MCMGCGYLSNVANVANVGKTACSVAGMSWSRKQSFFFFRVGVGSGVMGSKKPLDYRSLMLCHFSLDQMGVH